MFYVEYVCVTKTWAEVKAERTKFKRSFMIVFSLPDLEKKKKRKVLHCTMVAFSLVRGFGANARQYFPAGAFFLFLFKV